jgi:hypothetical protein
MFKSPAASLILRGVLALIVGVGVRARGRS